MSVWLVSEVMDGNAIQAVALSIATALVSIVTSYFFFRKTATEKLFGIRSWGYRVFKSPANVGDHLEIKFRGEEISSLHSVDVQFWNAGNQTISGTDINESDPLRICLPSDAIILESDIPKATHDRIAPTLETKENGHCININFYILEPNDGFSVRILLDGNGKIKESNLVLGSISGIEKIGRTKSGFMWTVSGIFNGVAGLGALLVLLMLIIAFIFDLYKTTRYLVENSWAEFSSIFWSVDFGIGLKFLFLIGLIVIFAIIGDRFSKWKDKNLAGRTIPPLSLGHPHLSIAEQEMLAHRIARRDSQLLMLYDENED